MSSERMVMYDGEPCRMVVEFYAGMVFVHLTVRKWGPDTLRLMRARWPEIRAILRRIGFSTIHAYYRASNASMAAFAGRFGFRELRRGGGWILMGCPNAT